MHYIIKEGFENLRVIFQRNSRGWFFEEGREDKENERNARLQSVSK